MSESPTCANCARWKPTEGQDGAGECGLTLPPWVAIKQRPVTWGDEACSLHIPRETPGEG